MHALVEKDVEAWYREQLRKLRSTAVITSPNGTDGYAVWDHVRLLLEAKFGRDFGNRNHVCSALGQCLLYVKRFEKTGERPNVILIGDEDECVVLSTESVKQFLDLPINWQVAPSTGDPALTRALVEQIDLLPHVFDLSDFRTVVEKIEVLAAGQQHSVRATLENLGAMFLYWRMNVFGDDLTAVEQVDVFLHSLFCTGGDVYLHPHKPNILVVRDQHVRVNADRYKAFFGHFVQGYTPSEIEAFYAAKDRLVEDDARRRQGAFFTPSEWVSEAHKAVTEALGENWRQECIVWDPAAGTGNLTRDYRFADLILSTAEGPDIRVIQDQGYNPGALKFQYDFLNPGVWSPFLDEGGSNTIPDAVHERLRAAAKAGKRLVFLMNPPYGTANNAGANGTSKAGIAKTTVNAQMKRAKLGHCSQQLYAQFMYQCARVADEYGFGECTVALFSVPTFMSSGSYRPFREWWYGRHSFESGFLFQASHFADVSGRWGISFTIWNCPGETDRRATLPITLKDKETFYIVSQGTKHVYSSDGREASKWVREPLRGQGVDAPQMSSGLKVKERGRGSLLSSSLAFFGNNANSLQDSGSLVYMVSSADTRNNGLSVLPTNWRRVIALYAARKLVLEAWDTQKDEYLAPSTEDTLEYEQWVDDCHVYALLHPSNNCTAMRDVQYKGKKWQIHNHFFWRTHADTLKALNTPKTHALYRDCQQNPSRDVFGEEVPSSPDPYMAGQLSLTALSTEAKRVLDLLDALWVQSLPLRESYAASRPDLHLTAWDAGVYQLKHLWRDLFPAEWETLRQAHRALAEKLQPGVYTHGFLMR